MIGLIHLKPWINSQFENTQAETLDWDVPDLYSLLSGLFWLGDCGRGWNIKQKGKNVGPKLFQGLYFEAYRTEKSLDRV